MSHRNKNNWLVFWAIVGVFQLHSCATILNFPATPVNIYTEGPATIIYQSDTIPANSKNKARLQVPRQASSLQMTVANDSLHQSLNLKAQNSGAYLLNAFYTAGIGFLIEKDEPKRYTYPRNVYLDASLNRITYGQFLIIPKKGALDLHVSIPYLNSFLLRPENETSRKLNTGFWGISLGLDYHYSDKQFLSLAFSGVTDFFLPVPAAVSLNGEYELMTSAYMSLSNNHRFHRFSLGYGFSLGRNVWELDYFDRSNPSPPPREPITKGHLAAGLIFPAYYQITQRFQVGLIYRPSFIRPAILPRYQYEHLISVDVAWKIPLNARK